MAKREEWHVQDCGYDADQHCVSILTGKGINEYCVAFVGDGYNPRIGPDECEERAHRIVREHNLHQKMLDALRQANAVICGGIFDDLIAEAEKG